MISLFSLALRILCAIGAAWLILGFESPVRAQSFTASLFGTTIDASGSLVPGVVLTATNTANNSKVETRSDSSGNYVLPGLAPGKYILEATANGFKKFVRSGLELSVQQQARIEVRLEVGAVNESVTVEAEVSNLDLHDWQGRLQ
jgi:hypothetical protein